MAEILDVDVMYLEYGHKKSAPAVSGKSDNRRLLDSYLDEFTEDELAVLLSKIKKNAICKYYFLFFFSRVFKDTNDFFFRGHPIPPLVTVAITIIIHFQLNVLKR